MAFSMGLLGGAFTTVLPSEFYRIQTIGGVSSEFGESVGIYNENFYVAGETNSYGEGGGEYFLAKYDSSGSFIWQKTFGKSGSEETDGSNAIAFDGSGNIYSNLSTFSDSLGSGDTVLVKHNASGNLIWQRAIGETSGDYSSSVGLDSLENVYIGLSSTSNSAGSYDICIAKYNSSGSFIKEKGYGTSDSDEFRALAVDTSTDNIYLTGSTNGVGILIKVDSNLNIIFQKTLSGINDISSIKIDSSGNVYTAAHSADLVVIKWDQSGNIIWQRQISGVNQIYSNSVSVDSQGNVYVIGIDTADGLYVIVKLTSSGSLVWQRTINNAVGFRDGSSRITSANNIFICGTLNNVGAGNTDAFAALLPADGSLTGTYNINGSNVTYASSSYNFSSSQFSVGSGNLLQRNPNLTKYNPSLISQSVSMTDYKVNL